MTQLSCVAVGLTLGSLIAVAPMIVNTAEWPPLAATATALFVSAFGVTLTQPPTSRMWAHTVGLGPLLVWFVRLIVETARDPTSHTLWPFELAAMLILCVLPASAGVWSGILFSKRRRGDHAMTAWLMIAAALAITSVSTWQTARRIAANESSALNRMRALRAAQLQFQAAHPSRGYSCDLSQLEQFEGPVTTVPESTLRNEAQSYEGRLRQLAALSWARDRGYSFRLTCAREPNPRKTFHLLGRPETKGATGNLVFCTNQSGEIRRSFWRNMDGCMSSGAIER